MKSQYLPLMLLSCVLLAGCGGGKDKKKKVDTKKREVFTQVDIQTANDEANFLFDDVNDEFARLDDNVESEANILGTEEFAWLEVDDILDNKEFDVVHFDYDKKNIRPDQEPLVKHNIEVAKEVLEEGIGQGKIMVEGHACSSGGSGPYNLALSEERAKVARDRFVAEGVPAEKIKIVARGSEVPVIINGQPLTGDRTAQAPNRRDEFRVIHG